MGAPDITAVLNGWWGGAYDDSSWWGAWCANSSGIIIGTNPPYSCADLLACGLGQFFGAPIQLANVGLTTGSAIVTVPYGWPSLAPGYLITGPGLPGGTVIVSVSTENVTLSQQATTTGAINPVYYPAPLVPIPLMNLYIALASASLNQARWLEYWYLGMSWYVAHMMTMWLRSYIDPNSNPTAAQVAQAGLEKGMLVAKSVGDVSGSYENMMADFGEWGAWAETTYGAQLISVAKVIGLGFIYVNAGPSPWPMSSI